MGGSRGGYLTRVVLGGAGTTPRFRPRPAAPVPLRGIHPGALGWAPSRVSPEPSWFAADSVTAAPSQPSTGSAPTSSAALRSSPRLTSAPLEATAAASPLVLAPSPGPFPRPLPEHPPLAAVGTKDVAAPSATSPMAAKRQG